jgi:VanZ family protein
MSAPISIRRQWLLLTGLYVVLIFFLSSRPYLHAPGPNFYMKDKLAHGIEYFVLGWLMARAIRPARTPSRLIRVLWFVALGAGIAATDEMFQGTIPGRVKDVTDWMADVTGLSIGATLSIVRAARAEHSSRNQP